jgi:renalase
MPESADVVVIGAGIAGLNIARQLEGKVIVLDKSRGVGGRMATRRADAFQFDHGCQFFSAKHPDFCDFLAPYIEQGVIADWQANFVEFHGDVINTQRQWSDEFPHYIAQPGMTSLCKALAETLDVRCNQHVSACRQITNGWEITTHCDQKYHANWLVFAMPAAQIVELLPQNISFRTTLNDIAMLPCYALMLGLSTQPDVAWQAACVKQADLSWISLVHSKPGRPKASSIVALASNAWAAAHLETDNNVVQSHLQRCLVNYLGASVLDPEHIALHRWRYANIGKQTGPHAYADPQAQVVACGDWCIQGRVEAAYLSSQSALAYLQRS